MGGRRGSRDSTPDDHLDELRPRSSRGVARSPGGVPSRSTVTRSVTSRTSSRSCETNSTLASPLATISRTVLEQLLDAVSAAGTPSARRARAARGRSPLLALAGADPLDRANDRQQRPLVGLSQLADHGRWVEHRGCNARTFQRAPAPLVPPCDPLPRLRDQLADAEVLEHRQLEDQAEVLVNERQPELAELPGRERQRDGLAGDLERPRVGRVEAVEDLDQGRLAGSVLAEEAMHLAGQDRQIDAVAAPARRRRLFERSDSASTGTGAARSPARAGRQLGARPRCRRLFGASVADVVRSIELLLPEGL